MYTYIYVNGTKGKMLHFAIDYIPGGKHRFT